VGPGTVVFGWALRRAKITGTLTHIQKSCCHPTECSAAARRGLASEESLEYRGLSLGLVQVLLGLVHVPGLQR
jgi:hypothetical protein